MSWLWFTGQINRSTIGTSKIQLHLTRSILSVTVLYLYFYSVSKIELATAVLFLSTSPIFLPILAYVLSKHRSDATVWIGVLIAFSGVILIVDPQSFSLVSIQFSWGVAAGILSGLFGGAATIAIWRMSETESPTRQIFYFTIISFILSVPLAMLNWRWPDNSTYIPLLALVFATTLAQFYLSKGCSIAPADKINTWNYLSIVVIGAHITTVKYKNIVRL